MESKNNGVQKRIEEFADLFLNDLDYSPAFAEANDRIRAALQEKAKELSFEELAESCGSLEKLAALAGYSAQDAKLWRGSGTALDADTLKTELRIQRRRIYGVALLLTAAISELVWAVFNAVHRNSELPFSIALVLLLLAGAWGIYRKFRSGLREGQSISAPAYQKVCELSDLYLKRLLHAIALFVAALALFAGVELCFYFFGNSKAAELGENIGANLLAIQLPLYLLIKNILGVRLMRSYAVLGNEERADRHLFCMAVFALFYWGSVLTAGVVLRGKLLYPANFFIVAGVVFLLLVLVYDLTLRRRITRQNIVLSRRRVAVWTAGALVVLAFAFMNRDTWFTQPYINSVPIVSRTTVPIAYDEESGVYTLTAAEGDFKILHLTDIHLGNSLYSYWKDIKALEACYAEIAFTKPDLVIVTGDLCFPLGIMSMSLNNSAPVYQFAAFMRNTGVPWAFTYGNHDTESIASMNRQELNEVYKSLSFKTSGNLLYPYVQPEISGRNNQLIELRNADGSLNTALFLLDSNAYTGEGINVYDYIHDDQVDWYASQVERLNREAGRVVPSLIFFHIPLQQYRTAYELYEEGSDEVTYYFGENGESMIDKVCCSDYPSALFDRILELGSTTGTFCGHDHYNNMSLEYKGVRLTYGMSIDYLAMPGIENDTKQRGAELITIHPDASWDAVQIPLTSIT